MPQPNGSSQTKGQYTHDMGIVICFFGASWALVFSGFGVDETIVG